MKGNDFYVQVKNEVVALMNNMGCTSTFDKFTVMNLIKGKPTCVNPIENIYSYQDQEYASFEDLPDEAKAQISDPIDAYAALLKLLRDTGELDDYLEKGNNKPTNRRPLPPKPQPEKIREDFALFSLFRKKKNSEV